jgi:hypothetical protein
VIDLLAIETSRQQMLDGYFIALRPGSRSRP